MGVGFKQNNDNTYEKGLDQDGREEISKEIPQV
jgi:hypothetical protein